jgi:CubicO group peptidase (beta-lactamase class C family)
MRSCETFGRHRGRWRPAGRYAGRVVSRWRWMGLRPVSVRRSPRVLGAASGSWVGVRLRGEGGVWHRGRLPDGAGTIFEIGSITKTFTVTLLADMAREGIVALDDPVQHYLPDAVRLPVHGRPITLEDLATHRSGLPRLPKGLLWPALTRDRRDPYAKLNDARLTAAVSATRPRRNPGRKVAYSNYGMGLLGYVLALRAGTTYEQLVRARICEPLGLVDTWIDTPEPERRRLAMGHTRRRVETPPWHLGALAGAGGLRSTAADLLAFPEPSLTDVGVPADRGRSRDCAPTRSSRACADRPRLADHAGRRSPSEGARKAQAAVSRGRDRRLSQLRRRHPGARCGRRRLHQPGARCRSPRPARARRDHARAALGLNRDDHRGPAARGDSAVRRRTRPSSGGSSTTRELARGRKPGLRGAVSGGPAGPMCIPRRLSVRESGSLRPGVFVWPSPASICDASVGRIRSSAGYHSLGETRSAGVVRPCLGSGIRECSTERLDSSTRRGGPYGLAPPR